MSDVANVPTIEDLYAAQRRIAADLITTPLLRSEILDETAQSQIFIKAECLQVTGAFKFRGACNRLRQFSPSEVRGGVVTWSSGNHGQAIAAAAKRLQMPATILMPSDSVATKVALTRAHGAQVIFFDRDVDDSVAMSREIAKARGATIVPPANDFDIICGQGTVALEILSQMLSFGRHPDMLLVPCGSGGLTAGCSSTFTHLCPTAEVYAVEPDDFDDTGRSLRAGTRLRNAPGKRTLCDALTAKTPAPLTFAINAAYGVKGLTVSDTEVVAAMVFAFRHLKLVLEPGGAIALASVLSKKLPIEDKTVAIICSGGNVDSALFAKAIAE